jgi:hypothetical protein
MFWSLAWPYLAKFVAPVAMGIAGIGIAIFLWSFQRRFRLGMVAGGVVGAAGSVLGHAAGVMIVATLYGDLWGSRETPERAFARAFGLDPGAEVTQIRSRVSVSRYTSQQLLHFHAPPATIAGIVRGRFERSSTDDCRRRSLASKRDAPAWWTPSVAPRAECWVAEPYGQYPPDAAWLLYDPSTGQAHFQFLAIDPDAREPDSPKRHFDVSDATPRGP